MNNTDSGRTFGRSAAGVAAGARLTALLVTLILFGFALPATVRAALSLSSTMYSNGSGGYATTDTSGGMTAINALVGSLTWNVEQLSSGSWKYTYTVTPAVSNKNQGIGSFNVQFGQQPSDLAWDYSYSGANGDVMNATTTDGLLRTFDRTTAGSVSPYYYDSWLDAANKDTTRVNVTTTYQGIQWATPTFDHKGSVTVTLDLTTTMAPMWGNIYMDGYNQTTNNGYGFMRNTAYDAPTQPFSLDGAIVSGKIPVPGVPTYALTLLFAGNGNGGVNGDIICTSGSACNPVRFSTGSALTLMPTPGANSIFAGWSGACTNTSGNCDITMDGDKSVTATFNDPDLIRIGSTHYLTLTAAFADAAKGQILARALEFTENLAVTLATNFRGGFDTGFAGNTGTYTTLAGVLTVKGGSLTVEGMVIR